MYINFPDDKSKPSKVNPYSTINSRTITTGDVNKWFNTQPLVNDNPHSIKILEDDERVSISVDKIEFSLYEYELLSMLETIKNILIESNILTLEQFNELYEINKSNLQQLFKDKIDANKVARKLEDKIY